MYNTKRSWLLYLFCLPYTLTISYPWVLIMIAITAAKDLKLKKGVLIARWSDWAIKKWKYSTTLGHGIIFQPNPSDIIVAHEKVHIRQIQDLMVLSFVIGVIVFALTSSWLAFILLWWSGGLWQLPNFLTAWLRGGDPYRDSEHERSAYSQTG